MVREYFAKILCLYHQSQSKDKTKSKISNKSKMRAVIQINQSILIIHRSTESKQKLSKSGRKSDKVEMNVG